MARLADPREAPALAAERAATLDLAPAGAAEAISGTLRGRPRMSGPANRRLRVAMYVANDASRDTRVLREADALAAAGHDVVLVARLSAGIELPTEEQRPSGVRLVRIPRDYGPATRWRSDPAADSLSVAGARGPRPRRGSGISGRGRPVGPVQPPRRWRRWWRCPGSPTGWWRTCSLETGCQHQSGVASWTTS